MKISNSKISDNDQSLRVQYPWDKRQLKCKEKIAPYIINPMNKYKIAWDTFMGFIYLFAYITDPFSFAFEFKPLSNRQYQNFTEVIVFIILFDMFLTPFTGIKKVQVISKEDLKNN